MKYKIKINDEDFLNFNIFYLHNSKSGKRSINRTRRSFPIIFLSIIFVLFISGVGYIMIISEIITMIIISIIWWIFTPTILEKNIQKNIKRMKKDGRLPYHADSEIEFLDNMIVERTEQGESHLNYKDIENVYFENDYIHIFYSAIQAIIIPCHCLGEDKEIVVEFIKQKINQ